MDELTAWLTLARAPGVHAGELRPLLDHLPSAAALLTAPAGQLLALGASARLLERIDYSRRRSVAADLRWLEKDSRCFIPLGHEQYPRLLSQLPDAPTGLYVRGDAQVLSLPQLAVVGSRNPTPTGRENAASFAERLAACGLTITSGLAVGVDASAHRGALSADAVTIAVCGAGLDVIYPRSNAPLADEVARRGALVSEFPIGAPPLKNNFPRRNRIISGLSLGVLVIEAAVRSGSLITARLAADQGREVFAVPGAIHNPLARGCHQLIRQGAKLIETPEDILVEIGPLAGVLDARSRSDASTASRRISGLALDKEYEILLDAFGFEPASVDALIDRSGLRADAVASMLLILELEGRIESYPGGLYVQRAHPERDALKAAK